MQAVPTFAMMKVNLSRWMTGSGAMKVFKASLATCILILVLASMLFAVEIKGVRFAEQLPVESIELHLTGVAVLKWAMLFDVYAGAFYLPAGHNPAAWAADVAKRLELSYFREIAGQGFADASIKLLRESLAADDYAAIKERLFTFCALFRDVRPGDRYSITYRPGIGTELRLNDRILGAAPGADFATAYFGIWLGDQPISARFRDRLLDNGRD
ncbi:MAG: chalcone isomerase family protein [Desulfuromonadales bacterium]|nr:chalcone isomerase family protein [Desulfuromonadales bacterium]